MESFFLKKRLPHSERDRQYAIAPLENHVGYVIPQHLRGSDLEI